LSSARRRPSASARVLGCRRVPFSAGRTPGAGFHGHPGGGELVSARAAEAQHAVVVLVDARAALAPTFGREGADAVDGPSIAMGAEWARVSDADLPRARVPFVAVVALPAQLRLVVHVGVGEAAPAAARGGLLHIED